MKLVFIKIVAPPRAKTEPKAGDGQGMVDFFERIGGWLSQEPGMHVSLELVGMAGRMTLVAGVPEEWKAVIVQQLYAAYPHCEVWDYEDRMFEGAGEAAGATVGFVPKEGELKPAGDGLDGLAPLLETMNGVGEGEKLMVQMVCRGSSPGLAAGLAADLAGGVADGLRRVVLGGEREAPEQADPDDKRERAMMWMNIRVVAVAVTASRAKELVRQAVPVFHQFASAGKCRMRYSYPRRLPAWLDAAGQRRPDRGSAFMVTAGEAAALYHAPADTKQYPVVEAMDWLQPAPPRQLAGQGLLLGRTAYRDDQREVFITPEDRLRHTYVVGQTGTGKSTLMQSAILQDMEAGEGCCFIDPHGEAIEWLLPRVPAHRLGDVVLFDPSEDELLLGLNVLESSGLRERDLLIQEVILMFRKLFDPHQSGVVGPQFEHWLRNAALTLTEPGVGGTLADVPKLFTDDAFQRRLVGRSQTPAVQHFWQQQMERTSKFHKSEMLNYFTSKFGGFLGNEAMRRILSQRRSAFKMRSIMDGRKILLVNLSSGKLGALNAQLLGAILMAKLQTAALSRADIPAGQRMPFYVYIDEFQNLATDSFAGMLSEIRKYGVGLNLAHQYAGQLSEAVKAAIVGNVGSMMAYRLGYDDAQWLSGHFKPLQAEDMSSIGSYRFYLRALNRGKTETPFAVTTEQPRASAVPARAEAIRRRVRNYNRTVRSATATR